MEDKINLAKKYIAELKQSNVWLEAAQMNLQCSLEMVNNGLDAFINHATATLSHEAYHSRRDFAMHFISWLRINKDRLRVEKKTTENQTPKARTPEPEKPSEEKINEIMNAGLSEAKKKVEGNLFYDDIGNAIYDWLDKQGRIPFNATRKNEFIAEAKTQLNRKYYAKLHSTTDNQERKKIKESMKELQEKNTVEVIILAKKIGLNTLIAEKIKLEEEIHQH